METKPAVKDNSLAALISGDAMKKQFAAALPAHVTPDRFVRVALTALRKTPKLALCTQDSVLKCLMDCSSLGIEPDGRRAHLIPYGDTCTLIVDYKGLIELVRRSGDVTSIRAETVCENDEFAWQDGAITHGINWRESRGKMQAVYAVASLISGETQSAAMTRDEVEAIRKRSRAGSSGPWVTDFEEMAKKTAVRRLCKMLPLSSEIMAQVEKDDAQFERNVTPRKRPAIEFALPEATEVETEVAP